MMGVALVVSWQASLLTLGEAYFAGLGEKSARHVGIQLQEAAAGDGVWRS